MDVARTVLPGLSTTEKEQIEKLVGDCENAMKAYQATCQGPAPSETAIKKSQNDLVTAVNKLGMDIVHLLFIDAQYSMSNSTLRCKVNVYMFGCS